MDSIEEAVMVGIILELAGFLLFVALVAVLYIWTRRTEAEAIYEPRVKSEDEANALRFGIAMNTPTGNLGGR
ncbi:MAG TPA: hypothetical protein VH298_04755 [Jatrophihabitans sp.]|nr:hypothetical protein [Jatrophihabitans sp.]